MTDLGMLVLICGFVACIGALTAAVIRLERRVSHAEQLLHWMDEE